MPRSGGVVGLSWADRVYSLIIYGASRISIVLGSNMHSVLPFSWSILRNSFNHSQPDVSQQALQHSLLPVEWDHSRAVDSCWGSVRVNVQLDRWAVLQQWQCLVFTFKDEKD